MRPVLLKQTKVIDGRSGDVRFSDPYVRLRYIWKGPAGDPAFLVRDSREIRWECVDVFCENECEAAFLFESTSGRGSITPPSTMNQGKDIRIFGNGLAKHGIWYLPVKDENNEHGRFDTISVYGCDVAARFQGQQSKEHLLTHFRTEGCRKSVVADSGFQWIGGTSSGADVAVETTRVGDPIVIQGVGFEACQRMLVTAGPASDAQSITLIGDRFEADAVHEDRAFIVHRNCGSIIFIGGKYGDGDQPVPHVLCAGVGVQSVTALGIKRGAYGSYGTKFVEGKPGVTVDFHEIGTTFENPKGWREHTSTLNHRGAE